MKNQEVVMVTERGHYGAGRSVRAMALLAACGIAGLAGTARATPAPDQVYSLYAGSYYYYERFCDTPEKFCTRDTSASPTFSASLDGYNGTHLGVMGSRTGNSLGSAYFYTPGWDDRFNKDIVGGAMFQNAMFDQFTLAGPGSAPVNITLTVHLSGEMHYTAYSNTGWSSARVRMDVGKRDQNYAFNLDSDRYHVIDLAQQHLTLERYINTLSPLSCKPQNDCAQGPVDLTGDLVLSVMPGAAFELGFALAVSGDSAVVDFGHTATIDFTLPDGYSLTSVNGWTDPNLPTGSIPEPATLAVLGLGLAGLGLARRRQGRG